MPVAKAPANRELKTWVCDNCGQMVLQTVTSCAYCGHDEAFVVERQPEGQWLDE